jgi:N-acetyl-gamma-glutamyl-phosphate reductase
MKKKIGIVGATGYTGVELIKILVNHPGIEITYLTSNSYAGRMIEEIYPHLKKSLSLELKTFDLEDNALQALDLVFVALPHGHAQDIVPGLLAKGLMVVDLGADFRYADIGTYEKIYQPHKAVETNKMAVYGLPEYNRTNIKKAKLIANPGCYVTAATLALKPLADAGCVVPGSIIVDAKSGVTGAGRSLTIETHYTEANENFSAYKLGVHRHQSEMEQNLGTKVLFSPHLLPVNRGILATCYATLNKTCKKQELIELYKEKYKAEPFVQIEEKRLPVLKDVTGSNNCYLGFYFQEEAQRVVIVSVIDNLLKGASGQAVQNMNLMCGFAETDGLKLVPLNP